MKVNLDIPPQMVADLMVSAIEHNHMTRAWCPGVKPRGRWLKNIPNLDAVLWYADPRVYRAGFLIEVREAQDDAIKAIPIHFGHLKRGIELMATKHGRHFGDWMSGNGDNITADVFLQCVAFGEVRYG